MNDDNVHPFDRGAAANVACAEEMFAEYTASYPIKDVYSRATDDWRSLQVRGGYSQGADELVAVVGDLELTQAQLLELAIALTEMHDALQIIGRSRRVISDES